ncbi:MAG: bifunctional DNA-formamidopyrimidine glycosylase/DNA-(apurinic or apyrimidinic site) lyase [Gammaproteobacteria bacterium]|nr:bifunctional DNA-formamidopyrimidine glycosylase/DNA-(apurinic or apyrimidinic site) lyase [Gammaproteobacteria bacterium]
MPELPEVETTRRGIEPHLLNKTVTGVIVRQSQLRWPVPRALDKKISGQTIHAIERRGKYILLKLDTGSIMLHLGMSGSLRVLNSDTPPEKHDHVDLQFGSHQCLRLRDPRRFGSLHWLTQDPYQHKLLKDLGPEPLSNIFDKEYLFNRSRKRKLAIKLFIMDSKIVVGVGNIYASEALFRAGIRPSRPAGRVTQKEYDKLVTAIKQVLKDAIQSGGTTLQDFTNSDGKPGYFKQALHVYGREGEACHFCKSLIKHRVMGQRATYYCPNCQS